MVQWQDVSGEPSLNEPATQGLPATTRACTAGPACFYDSPHAMTDMHMTDASALHSFHIFNSLQRLTIVPGAKHETLWRK